MTAKEKAKELFDKYCFAIRTEEEIDAYWTNVIHAKECAIIASDELIEFEKSIIKQLHKITKDAGGQFKVEAEFWEQVKQEIEKL